MYLSIMLCYYALFLESTETWLHHVLSGLRWSSTDIKLNKHSTYIQIWTTMLRHAVYLSCYVTML